VGNDRMTQARAALANGAWLDDVAAEYSLTGEEVVVLIRERLDGGWEEDHDGE